MSSSQPVLTSKKVEDLRPLDFLPALLTELPGAEPSAAELVETFKAGRQPYPPCVVGNYVVFGGALVLAAQRMGLGKIDVEEFRGFDRPNQDELRLKAIEFHRAAVLARRTVEPFDLREAMAAIYEKWADEIVRRPPRPRKSPEARKVREDARSRLIRDAFGRSQRSLERDVVLLYLFPPLRDAVRTGRLPERFIEAADKLPLSQQKQLAARLAEGVAFTTLKPQFFGSMNVRKTERAAADAIRKALRQITDEARGREHCFALRADEYAQARKAAGLLRRWLEAPPPHESVDEQVRRLAGERGRGAAGGGDDSTATGGDRVGGGPA